jgi:hypothetical protein
MNAMSIWVMTWEKEIEQQAQLPHSRQNPPFVARFEEEHVVVEPGPRSVPLRKTLRSKKEIDCLAEAPMEQKKALS